MKDEKYKSRTGWKSVGVCLWKQAKGKMKEHSRTESHILGIIRRNAFKRKALDTALEKADFEMQAAKERERQKTGRLSPD